MQSLARARTRFFTSYSHNLFSSAAAPTCGLRTLSHAHAAFAPLPTNPNAEPSSAYTFSSFSPLNGHCRRHAGAGYHHSLARFFSQQSSQPTSQPTVAAHAHVTVKTDEENEHDKIVGSQHLQLTQRRQGFIGKVYGIVATQLLATAAVSSAVVFNPSLSQFILSSPPVYYSLFLGSLLSLWPMHVYRKEHPKNLICLGAFTLMQSLMVGSCCALMDGKVVLEALATTTAAVTSLTGYTFWAAKRGKDFSYIGPILFPGLVAMATIGLINLFVYPVPGINSIAYNAIGALVFSGYLVLSTDNLIKRYTYDEYITASINIYLDILNLFLRLMQILSKMRK